MMTWSNECLINGKFLTAEASKVVMLYGLIDLNKSKLEPCFRNLGPTFANGPNNNVLYHQCNVSK